MWTWVYRSGQLLLASCVHFSVLAIHLFALHCICMVVVRKRCQGNLFFFVSILFFQNLNYRSLIWGEMGRNNQIVFCVVKWWISLFMSLHSLNLTPSPLLIHICSSVICHCKSFRTSFLAILKEAPSRCRLFFAWQCMCSLSKHTWLANDNLSSDMSWNLVSQNAVLRKRTDRVGEVGNDKKRRASTALCDPICIPQACDKVKLSPLGWHVSRRHFEVNTSQGCGSEIGVVATPFGLKYHIMKAGAPEICVLQ